VIDEMSVRQSIQFVCHIDTHLRVDIKSHFTPRPRRAMLFPPQKLFPPQNTRLSKKAPLTRTVSPSVRRYCTPMTAVMQMADLHTVSCAQPRGT